MNKQDKPQHGIDTKIDTTPSGVDLITILDYISE